MKRRIRAIVTALALPVLGSAQTADAYSYGGYGGWVQPWPGLAGYGGGACPSLGTTYGGISSGLGYPGAYGGFGYSGGPYGAMPYAPYLGGYYQAGLGGLSGYYAPYQGVGIGAYPFGIY